MRFVLLRGRSDGLRLEENSVEKTEAGNASCTEFTGSGGPI